MDGDVYVTTCETAWTCRKHTVNAQSEIGATVTVTVDALLTVLLYLPTFKAPYLKV